MWKNLVERGSSQMAIWRMRIACRIPKATNTHSERVRLIAFPLQQWLHERATVLRFTYCPLWSHNTRMCRWWSVHCVSVVVKCNWLAGRVEHATRNPTAIHLHNKQPALMHSFYGNTKGRQCGSECLLIPRSAQVHNVWESLNSVGNFLESSTNKINYLTFAWLKGW
jgi:hypothetical protein